MKHAFFVCFLVIFIGLSAVFLIPSFAFTLGNIFFGGIKSLYHVRLAQFLYTRAAYPIFSDVAPRASHYQLSRTYFIQGKLPKALEEARLELGLYPDHTRTHYILGLTNAYMNRPHEAIGDFSRYIEANPETWAGRNDKAWLQFRIGDIDGALKTIEPVVVSFPKTPWVQNTYCALLLNKPERLDEALQVCILAKTAADKMTPDDWGHAYPGNDPEIYMTGLKAMQSSAERNLRLVNNKLEAAKEKSP